MTTSVPKEVIRGESLWVQEPSKLIKATFFSFKKISLIKMQLILLSGSKKKREEKKKEAKKELHSGHGSPEADSSPQS